MFFRVRYLANPNTYNRDFKFRTISLNRAQKIVNTWAQILGWQVISVEPLSPDVAPQYATGISIDTQRELYSLARSEIKFSKYYDY